MRKLFKLISFTLLVTLSLTGAASCKKKNKSNLPDDQTIRISYEIAGFGKEWIYKAVDAFNKVYEGEYYAVVDRCDAGIGETVKSELQYPNDNQYDLYFTISDDLFRNTIDKSRAILQTRDKVLLECLDDVYSSYPIDLSGKEEKTSTIRQNTNSNILEFMTYNNPGSKWDGKTYAMQWTQALGGMIVNTKALAEFNLEMPRTTKELESAFDLILDAEKYSDGRQIYPVTWPGANASGYVAYTLLTWFAQWKGVQGTHDFYELKPESGDIKGEGYKVYDDEGLLYSLQSAYKLMDSKYACDGTVTTIGHLTSEQILADGEAVFAFTGDWAYNELIGCDYTDEELTQVELFQIPVISELAQKINLPGANADEQDSNLSKIIKAIDENKTDAEIQALVQGVTIEQINRIKEARGIYYDLGYTHYCVVPSYSNCIDGAKLFLRFISSKDFAENLYAKYAHGVTANSLAQPGGLNFTASIARCTKQSYSNPIFEENFRSPIRTSGAIGFVLEPVASWPDLAKGMANKTSGYDPESEYNKIKNGFKNNWEFIIKTSGVYEDN